MCFSFWLLDVHVLSVVILVSFSYFVVVIYLSYFNFVNHCIVPLVMLLLHLLSLRFREPLISRDVIHLILVCFSCVLLYLFIRILLFCIYCCCVYCSVFVVSWLSCIVAVAVSTALLCSCVY